MTVRKLFSHEEIENEPDKQQQGPPLTGGWSTKRPVRHKWKGAVKKTKKSRKGAKKRRPTTKTRGK